MTENVKLRYAGPFFLFAQRGSCGGGRCRFLSALGRLESRVALSIVSLLVCGNPNTHSIRINIATKFKRLIHQYILYHP